MRTAHPIMSVTGGLEGLVLEVLAGTTRPLTLTAVHRMASDASLSGVRKALLRLAAHGIVEIVPGGYVLNRDHLAANAIIELAGLRRALFDRIRSHVQGWSPSPLLVGVYGSVARHEGDEHSDIDVLVVADTLPDDEPAVLAGLVQRWTGNECQVVTLSGAELCGVIRRREPVVEHWRNELIVVAGDRGMIETEPR